jgi:hypothetical protein
MLIKVASALVEVVTSETISMLEMEEVLCRYKKDSKMRTQASFLPEGVRVQRAPRKSLEHSSSLSWENLESK